MGRSEAFRIEDVVALAATAREPALSVVMKVGGWVWSENLRRWFEHVSAYVGYEFDDSDWVALSEALPGTDTDSGGEQYEYPLCGQPRLDVGVALIAGDGVVSVVVRGDMDEVLVARVETLLDVL